MDDDDRVFKALADPTRRHLLDRLHERDGRTLGELESELAMTRSRPTRLAYFMMRSATRSGCSTSTLELVMTPGISTLSFSCLALPQNFHSCSWRGLAASNE